MRADRKAWAALNRNPHIRAKLSPQTRVSRIRFISWIVQYATIFFKSPWPQSLKEASIQPREATTKKARVLTSEKTRLESLKKPNRALLTRKPLRYIENPLGAST
jgi:hypothetical protein